MDCPQIPELEYDEFSKRLHKKVAEQRVPANGSLELTFRCNFRCKHCYVSHGHTGIPGKQELTTSEVKRILDEIVDAGCLWLLITGGDPLLRRDFMEIWEYAKRKGLILTLFTNGAAITPRVADFLAEWRPFLTEITLYGATQETYERVTGIKNSFARVMRGIELLLERKIPLKLKTMVISLNYHEFSQIETLAKNLGVKFRYDPIVNQGLDDQLELQELRISPQQVVQLEASRDSSKQFWNNAKTSLQSFPLQLENLYLCSAGDSSFHIDPYGNLGICMTERANIFNLREATFQHIWSVEFPKLRSRTITSQFDCRGCALRLLCPQCAAFGYLEHKNPEKKSNYLCEITHLREKKLGFE